MLDAVGQGVLVRVPAAVVRQAVVEVALHAPLAEAAEQQAAQLIRPAGTTGHARFVAPTCGRPDVLGELERLDGDDGRVARSG
jgi:hypothetical protein